MIYCHHSYLWQLWLQMVSITWLLIIFMENSKELKNQFVIFKPLSYCFEETTGFDANTSFTSRPVSRLIRWYNKRIFEKSYSVPRDFSWIESYKLKQLPIVEHYDKSKEVVLQIMQKTPSIQQLIFHSKHWRLKRPHANFRLVKMLGGPKKERQT